MAARLEILYPVNLSQNRVHRFSEYALALTVDYAHIEDPARTAFLQVIGNQFLDLARVEGVQIERTIYGYLDGIHTAILDRPRLYDKAFTCRKFKDSRGYG